MNRIARWVAALAILNVCPAGATQAQAQCRLALALALDVSGSVDAVEYSAQLQGVAGALTNPEVQAALFAAPDAPVALAVYEWSSSAYQHVIVDWQLLTSPEVVVGITNRLLAWRRSPAPEATGLGAALGFGALQMEHAPACWRQTLDVSGDGRNNDWPLPSHIRASGQLGSMTVNALVIGSPDGTQADEAAIGALVDYFRARVIFGPDAFIETARGFDDYEAAMIRKLLRELTTRPVGHLPVPGSGAVIGLQHARASMLPAAVSDLSR